MILYIGTVDEKKGIGNISNDYFVEELKFFAWPPAQKDYSRGNIKREIKNLLLNDESITAILIELSLDPLFYEEELIEIGNKFTVLGFFSDDGNTLNYSNQIAYYFDYILTTDFSQKLRYESIGIPSSFCLPGVNPNIFSQKNISRDIDILIYGTNTKGRIPKINFIKNEIKNLKIVDLTNTNVKVSDTDLVNYLNRSKITVNWAGVRLDDVINNFDDPLRKVYKIFKGRIVESGLMGCVCFTDFDYSNSDLFSIKFEDDSDLVEKIQQLISNDNLILHYSKLAYDLATSHLNSIQKPINVLSITRREKIKLKGSIINNIISTYTFINCMNNLRNLNFKLFLNDIYSIHWFKLMYKYLFFTKLKNIQIKIMIK